jgi:hypothetical protein
MHLIALIAAAACASENGSTTTAATTGETPPIPEQTTDISGSCPMMVEGTSVELRDAEGGVALAFTTDGDVGELRTRVDRMAEMHHDRMMPMAGSTLQVEDLDRGAQVIFRPAEPEQVEMLRLHMQKAAAELQSGACPTAELATQSEDPS